VQGYLFGQAEPLDDLMKRLAAPALLTLSANA
jgi:hypothetical protein